MNYKLEDQLFWFFSHCNFITKYFFYHNIINNKDTSFSGVLFFVKKLMMRLMNTFCVHKINLNYCFFSGIMGPPKDEEPDYVTNCKHPKFKKIVKLLYHVEKSSNVGGRFPQKKVMEVRIISVDTAWRGKGVSKMLFEKSL